MYGTCKVLVRQTDRDKQTDMGTEQVFLCCK